MSKVCAIGSLTTLLTPHGAKAGVQVCSRLDSGALLLALRRLGLREPRRQVRFLPTGRVLRHLFGGRQLGGLDPGRLRAPYAPCTTHSRSSINQFKKGAKRGTHFCSKANVKRFQTQPPDHELRAQRASSGVRMRQKLRCPFSFGL